MNETNLPATPMDTSSHSPSSHPPGSPSRDELLGQLLDACRCGHNDLELPEIAPLAQAIQQDSAWRSRWQAAEAEDFNLRRQLEDVPFPDGLEARLRHNLGIAASARSIDTATAVETATSAATPAVATPTAPTPATANSAAATPAVRRRSRRWFAVAGLASVAMAGLFALIVWQSANRPSLPDSTENLAKLGRQWSASMADTKDWQAEFSGFPEGRDARTLVVGERTRWRTLRTTCDRQTHVVEVRRGLIGAWLFSFQGSLPFLKNYLAPARLSGSGECDVWAWSDGGYVFLLVAQTPDARLDSWIRRPKFAVSPTPPAHVPPSQSPKSLQAERPLLSARHDSESRGRGLACVGFHGLSWAFWRLASA